MTIIIETIPHREQRYPTVGDWFWDNLGVLHIKVSKMSDERFCVLVALHELIEVVLCKHNHISQQSVDDFDIAFENLRTTYDKITNTGAFPIDEPGNDPTAPYYKQHQFASGVERLMAAELEIDWLKYEAEIATL